MWTLKLLDTQHCTAKVLQAELALSVGWEQHSHFTALINRVFDGNIIKLYQSFSFFVMEGYTQLGWAWAHEITIVNCNAVKIDYYHYYYFYYTTHPPH